MNEEKPITNSAPVNSTPVTPMQNAVKDILTSTPPYVEKLDPNLVQKPIRTFESDLAEALGKKQTSVASIAIAEQKKKDDANRAPQAQAAPRGPSIPPRSAFPIADSAPSVAPLAMPIVERPVVKPVAPVVKPVVQPIVAAPIIPPRIMEPLAPVIPVKSPPAKPSAAPVPPVVSKVMVPREPRNFHVKQILFTLMSLVLIAGGVIEGYLLYKKNILEKPVAIQQVITVPSLIPSDKQISLTTDGKMGNALITAMYSELNKNQLSQGQIGELLFFDKTGANAERVTGSGFISKLNTNMPDVINRSLTDRWMFGSYTEETGQRTSFLALTTDFFQNVFAGMLMWEDAMPDDLALVLDYKDRARKDELGADPVTSYFSIKGEWSDKVIKNRDVREFKNKNGELLLLYSFINKETLIVTSTESSFIALIDRIEKDTYVR